MKSKGLFLAFSAFFTIVFIIPYAVIPYIFAYDQFPIYVSLLAQLTIISVISFLISLNFEFIKTWNIPRIALSFDIALYSIFSVFILSVTTILITAQHIPFIESLKGTSEEVLTQYREDFLKGREGWASNLGYFSDILSTYFIPYFICLAFLRNHRYKFLFAFIFLLYCISSLEKAYFLKLGIPIFIIYLYKAKNKFLFMIKGMSIILGFIMLMYLISRTSGAEVVNNEDFFSILYRPTGSWESFYWRATIVPIVTALDGIRVFITEFQSQFFYGRTSSFLAFISGGTRINFERYLYETQFGGNGTGNANQFFVVEAYINFGIVGVIAFSTLIGKFVRAAIKSHDIALIAIIALFIYNLFNAGLIGLLLGNGFILFFAVVRGFKFK